MSVGEELFTALRDEIGKSRTYELGELTATTIRRYARAVGETDPLYLDADYSRSRGYPDVVAPPNLLVSIVGWGDGGAEARLRRDGTEVGEHLPGVPEGGVRVMGGGEEMVLYHDVVAGTIVHKQIELVDIQQKHSKEGSMAVLVYHVAFTDESGERLLESSRTVLLR